MYFLKRNFKIIVIYMLALGTIGALLAFLLVNDTYDYEEYYALSEPLTSTQEDELAIQLNQNVNSAFNEQVANLNYASESQYLLLSVESVSSTELSTVKNQFNELLEASGIAYEEGIDTSASNNSQDGMKALIIIISLAVGVLAGLLHSIMDKRIRTNEDVHYYLKERTLGTF